MGGGGRISTAMPTLEILGCPLRRTRVPRDRPSVRRRLGSFFFFCWRKGAIAGPLEQDPLLEQISKTLEGC